MRKYAAITFLVGVLLFILSQMINPLVIKGVSFHVSDILVNISATLLAISVFAILYYFFGEEPTTQMIKDLIKMQRVGKSLSEAGVMQFLPNRDMFNVAELHSRFSDGNNVFLVSRNFNAFSYTRVKDLLRNMLEQKKTIKMLVRSNTTRKKEFKSFIDSLSNEQKKGFEIRQSETLLVGMYGTEHYIFVTLHLEKYTGSESPFFICAREDDSSLYYKFLKEFDYIWDKAKPLF